MFAGTSSLITVIAATNEPWSIDSGFLRPGRFDKKVFVGPLDLKGRCDMLDVGLSMYTFVDFESEEKRSNVILDIASKMCDKFTGADIALFLKNIKMAHLRENEVEVQSALFDVETKSPEIIKSCKFCLNIKYIWDELSVYTPSVTNKDLEYYKNWTRYT